MFPKSTVDRFAESLDEGDAKDILKEALHTMPTHTDRGIAMITAGTLRQHLDNTPAAFLFQKLGEEWIAYTDPHIFTALSQPESENLEEEPGEEENEESDEDETD
jgi:hypothetical protein